MENPSQPSLKGGSKGKIIKLITIDVYCKFNNLTTSSVIIGENFYVKKSNSSLLQFASDYY